MIYEVIYEVHNRMTDIETRISTLEQKLILMSTELMYEKTRNEIYRELITNNTSIILESKNCNIRTSPEKVIKSTIYKSARSNIELREEETSISSLAFMNEVDVKINQQSATFGDVSDIDSKLLDIVERVKTAKNTPNKSITDLKQAKKLLFGSMKLVDYIELCKRYVTILTDIFKEKGFGDKKIISSVSASLTSLDMRLLRYNGYFNSHLDVDEIQSLNTVLDIWNPSPREHVVFSSDHVCDNMCNYGSVLFPIQMNLTRVLFNRYGFKNLIYLPIEKSTSDDPYSFYYLSSVNKDKRYWKMDCRLEDFTNSVIDNMMPYMVDNFRKMYRDVFGDNDYRPEYKTRCQLTECDCEQLLKNIFILSDRKIIGKILRSTIKEHAEYTPTKNDKFNIYSDDALQKKRFVSDINDPPNDITRRLFDSISSDEMILFSNRI